MVATAPRDAMPADIHDKVPDMNDDFDLAGSDRANGLSPSAALMLGAWYSIVFGIGAGLGANALDPTGAERNGILWSVAYASGAGFGISLASALSRSRRFAVGACVSVLTAALWLLPLVFLRDHLGDPIGKPVFGQPLSLRFYSLGQIILVLGIGIPASLVVSRISEGQNTLAMLRAVRPSHWLWLWLVGTYWMADLPLVGYAAWVLVATAFYAVVHPSLWVGSGEALAVGLTGTSLFCLGVDASLKAVADRTSYGGRRLNRVLVFLAAGLLIAPPITRVMLNMEIAVVKADVSRIENRPWWVF